MFAPAASVFVLALPLLATATALPRTDGQCNTGSIQCCNSVETSTSTSVASLLGLLGIPVGSITGLVGLQCTPVTVIGTGGGGCNQQAACCTGNSYNGLLVVGCIPINLSL